MALSSRSLITYGLTVTTLNQNLDFKAAALGSELTAVIPIGYYSPMGLADAVRAALLEADPANNYTVSIVWNQGDGTENRMTIATAGTFLSLLFSSGSHNSTSIASLIGFNSSDYTGSTSYVGADTVGTALVPTYIGYNFVGVDQQAKVFGAVNVSAAGVKEAVVFNIQQFLNVEFKYEPASALGQWQDFFNWAIQQKSFDFMPELSVPGVVYQVSLETTRADSKGLGFEMPEMLPNFPNIYQTGPLKFRIVLTAASFL